jgi:hypothetical protein
MGFWYFRTVGLGTPPPCCVDDAPYTTCTAPPGQPTNRGTVVMPIRRPRGLPDPPAPAPAATVESKPFSTADYQRDTHGHGRRRR